MIEDKKPESEVSEALNKTKGFLKKKAVEMPTVEEQKPQPTFVQVEEPAINVDALKVLTPNLNYVYHWCRESNVSNGRSGMWVVVDKKHPDFVRMSVPIDHAPNNTFFKYKDLILCCVRKETAEKRRKLHSDKIKARLKSTDKKFGEDIKRIQKSLGSRSEAIKVMEQLEEESSV